MTDPLVGRTLAHFRILARLGQGGMGVVYKAQDESLRRVVALKVLPEDFVADEERRRRFLREARSGGAVTHANIATVHEIGEADGRVYIAMELIEGKTLRDLMLDGPLPIRQALGIAKAVARGLAKAHEKGIVHRDLKPDNVMVTDDGDVKVLDFGVATWVRQADGPGGSIPPPPPPAEASVSPAARTVDVPFASTQSPDELLATAAPLTEAGRLIGTPAYMSPEQATGRQVDQRADIFSFGIVLYEMVVGRRPFASTSGNMTVLIATTSDTPEPPSKRNPAVTPALERLIERCLQKLPEQRYASARDLLHDLESIVAMQTMATLPSGIPAPAAAVSAPGRPDTLRSGAPPPRVSAHSTLDPASPPTLAGGPITEGKRGTSKRRLATAIGAVALLAAGAIGASRLASSSSPPPPPPPSAAAAPRPTALTDLPPPKTSVPEALAAYTTAMQAFHDGNFEAFDAGMRDAIRLDPSFAAGELRVAFAMWHSVRGSITDARNHLSRAALLRAALSTRDQALLDALEPVINREPPDSDETERRLRAAVDAYPRDAEFLYLLANEQRRYDVDLALATFDRVLAVDPMFMTALRQKAQTLEMKGDVDGARAALDACLRDVPGATGCRNERIWLNQDEGACSAIEGDAKQMIAADPDSYRGYEALARAGVAVGRPREAIDETLRQAWARAPAEVRARDELLTAARLAALDGRFDEARERGNRFEAAIAGDTAAATHAKAALFLAELAIETGEVKAAGALAEDYLRRQIAWSGAPDMDAGRMLRIERLAGTIDGPRFVAARQTFLDGWLAQASRVRFARGVAWVVAYGALVEGPDDAREALATLDAYAPVPVGLRTALNDDALGRARFYGGQAALAVPSLARASRMCTAFDEPFRHVRAQALFGEALEATGDVKGACDAYAKVVARWGGAKPASQTAARVKRRAAALRCP